MSDWTQAEVDREADKAKKADDYTRIPAAVAMVLSPEVKPDYSMRAVVTLKGAA